MPCCRCWDWKNTEEVVCSRIYCRSANLITGTQKPQLVKPQHNALNKQPCFPHIPTCYPGLPILTQSLFCIPLLSLILMWTIAARKEAPLILPTYAAFHSTEWETTVITPSTCIRMCVCKCVFTTQYILWFSDTFLAIAAKATLFINLPKFGLIRPLVFGNPWSLLNHFQGLNVDPTIVPLHMCSSVLTWNMKLPRIK